MDTNPKQSVILARWVVCAILASAFAVAGMFSQAEANKPAPRKPEVRPNETIKTPAAAKQSGTDTRKSPQAAQRSPDSKKKEFQPRNKAEQIVEKMVAAMGGRANLSKIHSMKATGITLLSTPLGERSGELITYSKKPAYQRVDISIGGQKITQSFYPGGGWLQQGSAVLPMPRSMLSVAQAESNRTDIELRYFMDGIKVQLVGERMVDKIPCYVIHFVDKENRKTEYAVAKDTWFPLQRSYHGPSPLGGGTVKFSTHQSDFRWVFFPGSSLAVKVPFRIGNFMNDRKIGSIQLKEVNLNDKQINPELFQPPNPTE